MWNYFPRINQQKKELEYQTKCMIPNNDLKCYDIFLYVMYRDLKINLGHPVKHHIMNIDFYIFSLPIKYFTKIRIK